MIFNDLKFEHAGGDGGRRTMTQMIVIHATDNTASDEDEASYATHRPDQTSAHFYSDEDSVIQALDTDEIAYGCYPMGNVRSVQFELVGRSNAISDATMRRVAPIVARVCKLYNIPVRKLGPADLVNGNRGICGHADVTYAWHQGDHTDPGSSFPWQTFIGYVEAAAGIAPAPVPTPGAPAYPLSYPPNFYGDINGPWYSHGGFNANERPNIVKIQNRLNGLGYHCGAADGIFGPMTIAATKAFQAARHLSVDGEVGPQTWRALFS